MNPARVAPVYATPVLWNAMVTKCQNASSHAAPQSDAFREEADERGPVAGGADIQASSDNTRLSFFRGRPFAPSSAERRLCVDPNASPRLFSDARSSPPRRLPSRPKHAASAQAACATNSTATREKRARLISLGVGVLPCSVVFVSSIRMHGWYPPHTNAVNSNRSSGGIARPVGRRPNRLPRSLFAPRFWFISATLEPSRVPRPVEASATPSPFRRRRSRRSRYALPEKRPSLSRRVSPPPACSLRPRALVFGTCEHVWQPNIRTAIDRG